MENTIKKISQIFFEKMWITLESLEVTEEKESIYFIKIQTPDSSLLIGNRGQTLHDTKKILSILLSHKLETKIIARVEVNNYLEEKDKKLFDFIDGKIELSKQLWKDIKLPFFSAYERKKIHNYISEKTLESISTKSEWEGKDRRLFICKQHKKMTIDIDGIEIKYHDTLDQTA